MDKPSSYSVAPGHNSRQSVLSRGALAGVVGMALIGLVLVFPKDDLLSRLRRDTVGADRELTIAYLRNLIRTEQADVGLRLLLVDKLIASREYTQAQSVLAQAGQMKLDAGQRTRIAELDTQITWTRFRDLRESLAQLQNEAQWDQVDGRHRGKRQDAVSLQARLVQLRAELEAVRKQLEAKLRAAIPQLRSSKAGFALMQQADDVGVPELGKEILLRLRGVSMPPEDAIRAARTALALGQYQAAAEFYLMAKNESKEAVQRRELIMQSVKVHLAAGQAKLAYETALRELQGQDKLAFGDEAWWQIIDWALGAGLPKEAAEHLLQVVPLDWSAQQLAKNLPPERLVKAFDIAMAGADLPAAIRMAQAGLIQAPADAKLRARFAQVLEWGGKPIDAMAQWLALMQRSASEQSVREVFRLATMLYDDDALLAAWIATSQKRALALEEIVRVVAIYERIGQPENALSFIDKQLSQPKAEQEAQVLRLQAHLLDRMARPAQAISIFETMKSRFGHLSRNDAVRLATLHMLNANPASALNGLLGYQPPAQEKIDAVYWDLRADLAYETRRLDLMREALLQLLAHTQQSGKLSMRDYQVERLINDALVRGPATQAVAWARILRPYVLAGESARFDARFMTLWLEALAGQVERAMDLQLPIQLTRADLDEWMAALTPAQKSDLGTNALWLSRRAVVYIALGEKKLAAADYRASLAQREEGVIRAGYWWLLIDMADTRQIRREMAHVSKEQRADAGLLEVQGASWQMLGEWRQALGFYRLQTRDPAKAQDALWLANYSDVLEQAGDVAIAQRVRKQSFTLLAQPLSQWSTLKKREAAQLLILRVRMSERFASGVEKERLQKVLGLLLQSDTLDPELRKQAQGLIISWALGGQSGSGPQGVRNELARRWLFMQQARKLTAEDKKGLVYAQAALALAEGDVQTLDRIMEHSANQLQTLDRLNALRTLARNNPQRLAEAASYGVELMHKEAEAPRNEQLQETMEQELLRLASRVRVTPVSQRNEVLASRGVQIHADIAITPRLRLTMDLDRVRHHSTNPAALVLPAQQDLNLRIGARLAIDGGEISGQFTQRSAWRQVSGLVLQLTRQLDLRTSVQARLELRQPSTDSAALTVAGMQDRVALNLTHQLARDAVLGMEASFSRYRTQDGSPVGQGKSIALNGTYFLRREYPDISFRASINKLSTSASGTPDASTAALNPAGGVPGADFFVPQGGTALNLSLGYGVTQSLDNREAYSRAVRPYAEIGAERRFGAAGTTSPWMRMGVRGAVAGRDQLAVGVEIKPAPDNTGGTKINRQLKIQYEWIGDR